MSGRAIYRIIKLDGLERYKVQKFFSEQKKWFGLWTIPAGWKDMVTSHTYGGKSYTHDSLKDAQRHIERLKRDAIIERDKWVPVESDL